MAVYTIVLREPEACVVMYMDRVCAIYILGHTHMISIIFFDIDATPPDDMKELSSIVCLYFGEDAHLDVSGSG